MERTRGGAGGCNRFNGISYLQNSIPEAAYLRRRADKVNDKKNHPPALPLERVFGTFSGYSVPSRWARCAQGVDFKNAIAICP